MDRGDTRRDVLKVRDVDGDVKQGKGVVTVWKNHFEKLLNAGQPSEGERAIRHQVKQNNSLLNEDLMMQEEMWALERKAAPGRDSKEVLWQVWYELDDT